MGRLAEYASIVVGIRHRWVYDPEVIRGVNDFCWKLPWLKLISQYQREYFSKEVEHVGCNAESKWKELFLEVGIWPL